MASAGHDDWSASLLSRNGHNHGRNGPNGTGRSAPPFPTQPQGQAQAPNRSETVIETIVNPFHCLYQDALFFHTQSQLRITRSETEASRMARASLLLYLSSAEALVHQAAVELGRPELSPLIADPSRPLPLSDAWRLLPAIAGEGPAANSRFDPSLPPWPQFSELLTLRASWSYPGPPSQRKAYYHSATPGADYEPLEPHQAPAELRIAPERLVLPKTGLPRDPYALRPHHLDTARAVLDAAILALDRRLDGALTRDQRHRREPIRVAYPPTGGH